jgi:hypothetical protein
MYIIVFCLLILKSLTADYTQSVDVWGDDTFLFIWTVDTEAKTITYDIEANTKGWVGVALSPNGELNGSDAIIGFVEKATGEPKVNDYFIVNDKPVLDTSLGGSNDIADYFGAFSKAYTHLHIVRNLQTPDSKYDVQIEKGKTYNVILFWRDNKSIGTSANLLPYTKKTVKQLVLYPSNLG